MKHKRKAIVAGFAAAAMASAAMAGAASAAEQPVHRREHRELNEDQRDAMSEIRALRKAGDLEGAAELAESVGLPAHPRAEGHRRFRGIGGESHAAVRGAVESEDYGAFEGAVSGSKFAQRAGDNLDDVFDLMVEAHDLREAGDHDGARGKMESVRELLGEEQS